MATSEAHLRLLLPPFIPKTSPEVWIINRPSKDINRCSGLSQTCLYTALTAHTVSLFSCLKAGGTIRMGKHSSISKEPLPGAWQCSAVRLRKINSKYKQNSFCVALNTQSPKRVTIRRIPFTAEAATGIITWGFLKHHKDTYSFRKLCRDIWPIHSVHCVS